MKSYVILILLHSLLIISSQRNLKSQIDEKEVENTEISVKSENIELSKDIGKLVLESNLGSYCETNVFVSTNACENHLSFVLADSLNNWGPAVIVSSYDYMFQKIQLERPEKWKNIVSRFHRQCKLIFICDMNIKIMDNPADSQNETLDLNMTMTSTTTTTRPKLRLDKGFLIYPKLIQIYDHVLYFKDNFPETLESDEDYEENVLDHVGILLSLEIEKKSTNSESIFRVFTKCKYCGVESQDMGQWQRNRSLFSPFFTTFDNNYKTSFLNYDSFTIGYSHYPPHISCHNGTTMTTYNCSGVDWEMLILMSTSLNFNFYLKNFTTQSQDLEVSEGEGNSDKTNYNGLIEALNNGEIDIAIGGITTSTTIRDHTNVFTHQPIVFVVEKRHHLYILGIWLAFKPEVWPLIIVTIFSVALTIKLLLRTFHVKNKVMKGKRKKEPTLLEGLEMSLQPLLNQPLTRLPHHPRRMLKLVLALWWFACIIVSTVYNTNLITSLINPLSPPEPETLQDLVHLGYRFLVGQQSGVFHLIDNGGDGGDKDPFRQIKSRLISDDQYKLLSRSRVAHVMEESAVKAVAWKDKYGVTNTKTLKERLILTGYWWPLKRDAPYRTKFNIAAGRLTSAGLIDHWYEKYKEKKRTMSTRAKIQANIKVDLTLLSGAFIFLLLGCFLASMVFIREHFTFRYTFRFATFEELVELWHKFVHKVQELDVKHEGAWVDNTILMVVPTANLSPPVRQKENWKSKKKQKVGGKQTEAGSSFPFLK